MTQQRDARSWRAAVTMSVLLVTCIAAWVYWKRRPEVLNVDYRGVRFMSSRAFEAASGGVGDHLLVRVGVFGGVRRAWSDCTVSASVMLGDRECVTALVMAPKDDKLVDAQVGVGDELEVCIMVGRNEIGSTVSSRLETHVLRRELIRGEDLKVRLTVARFVGVVAQSSWLPVAGLRERAEQLFPK